MDITRALTVRVADTRFVLTELARLARSGVFAGRLDLGRIGMFGHSLGGAAAASAMLVDRASAPVPTLMACCSDTVRTSGLSRPFLLMNAEPGFAARTEQGRLLEEAARTPLRRGRQGRSALRVQRPRLLRPGANADEPDRRRARLRQLVGNVDGLATLAAERAYIQRLLRPVPAWEATTTAHADPRSLRRHAPDYRR